MVVVYFKKGQLEIGITMMVILVFIILLIVSLVFYFRLAQGNIKETRQEILDEKYSGLLDAIINLPELRGSLSGAEKNCLDVVKLKNFKDVVSESLITRKSEYYNNLLGDVNAIWIDAIYINTGEVLKEKNKYLIYRNQGNGLIYSSPVSICNSDKFEAGVLNIQIK